jgi:hypothetical protein
MIVQRDGDPETWRVANRAYADAQFTEPLVDKRGWGKIRRALSDDAGQPEMTGGSVSINDNSHRLKNAIKEDPSRFQYQTEGVIETLSREARKAGGTTWRPVSKCRVQRVDPRIDRQGRQRTNKVNLALTDVLAPYYDQVVNPYKFLRSDFPDISREIENTYIPIIGGTFDDSGTVDINGNDASLGLIPPIYVGGRQTVDDLPTMGTPWRDEASFLTPPLSANLTVNGTPGTTFRSYGITKRSATGETTATILTTNTSAATLNGTDSITLDWAADPDCIGINIYRGLFATPNTLIATLGPVTTYTDTGAPSIMGRVPPEINTAQVELEPGGFFWDFYVVGIGYIPITGIGASSAPNVEGVQPRRVFDPDWLTNGVDFLLPTSIGWPHSKPTITLASGIEITGFYGRGPRSYDHVQGIVTIALKTCGPTDTGDETGESIRQAAFVFQDIVNKYLPADNNPPWDGNAPNPALRTFADGSAIIRTSKVQAWQDQTKVFLGNDVGYLGSVYIRGETWRELITNFNETFNSHNYHDHHGGICIRLYDPSLDITEGRLYREKYEIVRIEAPELDDSFLLPELRYSYAYSPDQQKFRVVGERAFNQDALDTLGTRWREKGVLACYWTQDPSTARDAQNRKVGRLCRPRWRQTLVTKASPGFENEPLDQIRISHRDPGWTEQPFAVITHEYDPNTGEVVLTAYDVLPLLTTYQESVMDGDNAQMPFVMG